MDINPNILLYICAYLIGSIPFGALLVKIFAKQNILEIGSKSTGATNVYRAFAAISPQKAKFFSLLTLLLDAFKGLFIVLIAKLIGLSFETQYAIAILAILGHCYSPFLGFNGGKGVATAIGSVLLLIPVEGICGLIVWGVVGKVFKISSLSSLLGVLSGIILTFVIPSIFNLPESININAQIGTHVPVVLIGVIIINTHWENIKRLVLKQEQQFTDSVKPHNT
ncbi:glycerol-3-phosphate 1-O-acyltransferase PlsY [Helicobacter trogontum]|uniref:Glycerol-3-phosphate acyltransferase n=1 Tax=Helicobacter trogontum TaxID=50960 RepID=A0A4U8SA89_9HELI|nr:glycerol-3-phosphate 1-O-acyltransferase PlsY [Helicobacter trogontum]TLD82968.1 glycerol-3-phosphate 1-O-acyltransferase PlsY [Helicobacter trogontum]